MFLYLAAADPKQSANKMYVKIFDIIEEFLSLLFKQKKIQN